MEPTITQAELADQLARLEGQKIYSAAGLARAIFDGAALARTGGQAHRASKGWAA
jgi:hypothetical protein